MTKNHHTSAATVVFFSILVAATHSLNPSWQRILKDHTEKKQPYTFVIG